MKYYTRGKFAALQQMQFDADQFAQLAQEDDTADFVANEDKNKKLQPSDKPPRWGQPSSLEAGDAGTRNYQMGLPSYGGV